MMVSGCATTNTTADFHGYRMRNHLSIRELVNLANTEERVESIHNLPTIEDVDTTIIAWGIIRESLPPRIEIQVFNSSNLPIPTNYFGDQFALFTTDDKIYYLEQEDSPTCINPNERVYYRLKLPSPIRNIKKDDVRMIICELGVLSHVTAIVLTRTANNNEQKEESKPHIQGESKQIMQEESKPRQTLAKVKLSEYFYVDKEGVLFGPISQEDENLEVPLIVGLEARISNPRSGVKYNENSLQAILEFINNLNKDSKLSEQLKIKEINLANINDVFLFTTTGCKINLGGIGSLNKDLSILQRLINEINSDITKIEYIDLRFREPVVKYK